VDEPDETPLSDSILTVPNLFTLVRLLCLPLFVWLLFVQDDRQNAAWLLGILGATDWVDGYLARRLGQSSEFGAKFDPTVDRLLFIVAVVSILVDGSAPRWVMVLILVREVAVGGAVAIATLAFGMERFDVTYRGKLATFLLMFAVPGFLLGSSDFRWADAVTVASWILVVPGLVLSYWTAFEYVPKIRAGVRAGRLHRSAA
jgi:cardiolipin synthase